jgi:hypothetical protein
MERVAFDAQFTAAHRVTAHDAGIADDPATAGEAEVSLEMRLRRRGKRKAIGAFGDFDDAFLAAAVFATGRGDPDAEGLGVIEQRQTRRHAAALLIEM